VLWEPGRARMLKGEGGIRFGWRSMREKGVAGLGVGGVCREGYVPDSAREMVTSRADVVCFGDLNGGGELVEGRCPGSMRWGAGDTADAVIMGRMLIPGCFLACARRRGGALTHRG